MPKVSPTRWISPAPSDAGVGGTCFDRRSAGRTRTETALAEWVGKRAGTGRIAPRGFPRDNRFT
ncbi:MAG TPA: hypothetical protein VJ893_00950 [Roseovarius sp.]|nr:hypothetical protein [Roseovarius sp.]